MNPKHGRGYQELNIDQSLVTVDYALTNHTYYDAKIWR